MKKYVRILVKTFLVGIMCMSLIPINSTYALEDDDMLKDMSNTTQHYENSEYGSLMNKINQTKKKTYNSYNYNTSELFSLLKEREAYHEYFYQLKDKNITELENMNFNKEQIDAIKTFDGTDEKALRASAYISATLKLTQFKYTSSDNRTHASATFSGKWVGTPLFKMQDTTAIGMIGSLSRFVKKSSSNKIVHADGKVVTNTGGEYHSSAGQSYKFGICNVNSKIFKSFSMTYSAYADGKNTLMDYGAIYAHYKEYISSTGVSIGVSGSGASIGINFKVTGSHDVEWKHIYPQSTYI